MKRLIEIIDHFFPSGTTLENFRDSTWEELGDFAEREWQSERKGDDDETVITFRSDGTISGVAVKGEKEFIFRKGSRTIDARIRFEPDGTWPEGRYGVAFNFTLLAADAPDRYYLFDGARPEDSRMASEGAEERIKCFSATDDYQRVGLEWELGTPCDVWRAPIMTISRSESGFEKSYQGSWVMIHFPLPASSDAIELALKWKILRRLKKA